MSLLLSQLGRGSTTTLIADAGAAALPGRNVLFRIGLAAQARSVAKGGSSAAFHVRLAGQTAGIAQVARPAGFDLRCICVQVGFAQSSPSARFTSVFRADSGDLLGTGALTALGARFAHVPGAWLLAGFAAGLVEGEPAPETVGGGAGVRMSGASFSRRRYREIAHALERERTPTREKKTGRKARRPDAAAKPTAPARTYALVVRSVPLAIAVYDAAMAVTGMAAGARFSAAGEPTTFCLRVRWSPVRIRTRSGVTWFSHMCPLEWPAIERLPDLSTSKKRRRNTRRRRKLIDGRLQQIQPIRRGPG